MRRGFDEASDQLSNEWKEETKSKTKSGLKQEKYELTVKNEGKGHTHYPAPSNVFRLRRAIELVRTLHVFIFTCFKGCGSIRDW